MKQNITWRSWRGALVAGVPVAVMIVKAPRWVSIGWLTFALATAGSPVDKGGNVPTHS